MITIENTLAFAEWIDLNGIRNGQCEWKYKGDNYKGRYTTKEMFNFYISEQNG